MQNLSDCETRKLVDKFNTIFSKGNRNLKAKVIGSNILSIENDEVIVVYEALQDERKIYLNRIKRPYLQ